MRAGVYAEVDGVLHQSTSVPVETLLHLRAPLSRPCPPGFVRGRHAWERTVHVREVRRMVSVRTTARWLGHEVRVLAVDGDTAHVDRFDWPPPDDPRVTNRRPGEPWEAFVPVDELTDVREEVTELPVPDALRAGTYAWVEGVAYAAEPAGPDRVRLLAPASRNRPTGFVPGPGGWWTRVVRRAAVHRVEQFTTVAVWQGRRVTVARVRADEALVQHGGPPPVHPLVVPAEGGGWTAWVPVDELTEVVEQPG